VTASWWCWWYGGGLGMRPYVEYLVLFVLPIAFLWQYAHLFFKVILIIFSLGSLLLYQLHHAAYKPNILITYFTDNENIENAIYFGGKFPTTDKTFNIELAINPRLKFEAIDSIHFKLMGTSELLTNEELELTIFEID
jgi:hypothetical protein